GRDAGDDLDLDAVLLLERLDQCLLHHLLPAAAVSGDDEGRLLLGGDGRSRDEGCGQDREQDEGAHARTSTKVSGREVSAEKFSCLLVSRTRAIIKGST